MKLWKSLCILLVLGGVEAAFAQFKSKLNDLKNSVEGGLEDNIKAPPNLDSLKNDVRQRYDELKEYFKSLEEKFDKTRDFLLKNNLPASIIKRHDDFVKEYHENKKQLFRKIDDVLATTNLKSYRQKAQSLAEEIERLTQEPKHYPEMKPAFIPVDLQTPPLHVPPPQQIEREAQELYERHYKTPPPTAPS